MNKLKKSVCLNCGFVKPKEIKNPEKLKYCSLCDIKYMLKDSSEHKNNYLHKIKNEIIKKIKNLDGKDESDKKKIDQIHKSLTPMYKQ